MTRPNNGSGSENANKGNMNVGSSIRPKKELPDCYEVLETDDDICELEHLRKLFIGGLAPYTTEESLKAFYEQWGKVVDVVVMRDTVTRRSRGFGFITYTKAVMVDKAQDARPHIIDGKTVEAKRALPRPEREKREPNISVKKLFVGGLKDNHDDDCLNDYFSQFGKVVSVKILTDKTTGKRRGFAFIEFDDYDAVDKAILKKTHSIKYVMVDVKKSVYSQEQQRHNAAAAAVNKQIQANNLQQPRPNMNGPTPPGYGPPVGPPRTPYQHGPPMNAGPPPNYNYWNQGPPQQPPPPQYYGGYQQPQPQPPMNSWNYPVAPQGNWNSGPPPPGPVGLPPPVAANWQQQPQWGPPPGPPAAAAPPPNWNAAPPAMAPNGPPAVAGPPAAQSQAPPPNFGTGYQQNYGGGPTKTNHMSSNRMNPYGAAPHYGNHGSAPPAGPGYSGYNSGPPTAPPGVGPNIAPPVNGNMGPGPGPKPVPTVSNGNRRY